MDCRVPATPRLRRALQCWAAEALAKAAGPAMTGNSIHLLVGVDTPQPLLFDPAVKAVAGHVAPACRAVLDQGDDAGLQTCGDRAGLIGALIEWGQFVLALHGDDGGAAAPQQRVIDLALGAFGIAQPAPVLLFGGSHDRQA